MALEFKSISEFFDTEMCERAIRYIKKLTDPCLPHWDKDVFVAGSVITNAVLDGKDQFLPTDIDFWMCGQNQKVCLSEVGSYVGIFDEWYKHFDECYHTDQTIRIVCPAYKSQSMLPINIIVTRDSIHETIERFDLNCVQAYYCDGLFMCTKEFAVSIKTKKSMVSPSSENMWALQFPRVMYRAYMYHKRGFEMDPELLKVFESRYLQSSIITRMADACSILSKEKSLKNVYHPIFEHSDVSGIFISSQDFETKPKNQKINETDMDSSPPAPSSSDSVPPLHSIPSEDTNEYLCRFYELTKKNSTPFDQYLFTWIKGPYCKDHVSLDRAAEILSSILGPLARGARGVYVTGGSVVSAFMQSQGDDNGWFEPGDLDIVLCEYDDESEAAKTKSLKSSEIRSRFLPGLHDFTKFSPNYTFPKFRSYSSVIVPKSRRLPRLNIMYTTKTIEELMATYDMDIVRCAFDVQKRKFVGSDLFLTALYNRSCFSKKNPALGPRKDPSVVYSRASKYALRGFRPPVGWPFTEPGDYDSFPKLGTYKSGTFFVLKSLDTSDPTEWPVSSPSDPSPSSSDDDLLTASILRELFTLNGAGDQTAQDPAVAAEVMFRIREIIEKNKKKDSC